MNEKEDKQSKEIADKNRRSSLKVKEVFILWNALQRDDEFVAFITLYPEYIQSAYWKIHKLTRRRVREHFNSSYSPPREPQIS